MADRPSNRVVWIMRKPRSLGNFSIETSYRTMHKAWPKGHTAPGSHIASRYSSGFFARWAIRNEVRQLPHPLIHITGDIHFAAIGLRRPAVVLTIHDLGMLGEGGAIKRWLKRWFWLTLPLRSCDYLIAVSPTTKADILARIPYPEDRIHVIPSVISPTFIQRTAEPTHPKPRVLHIGLADNKNLEGHAKALEGMEVHLRIIGEPSGSQRAMLDRHRIEYSTASKLTELELQGEYAEADVLLFCSTLEGYGMPIIEAQTIGVPVVTSDRAPMNDTAGGGAQLADPDDPKSIRSAVSSILDNQGLKRDLIEKGFENAERCSAARSAELHAQLYTRILGD